MLATERLLEIEETHGGRVQRVVPLELDGEALRLILYLKDGTNLRVTEQWQGETLLRYSYYWLTSVNELKIGVRPGITGWAQVNGRNALTWEQKFALDVWYVDHWSPWLDLRIIALTVWEILKREGISHPGQATMEEFEGNAERV